MEIAPKSFCPAPRLAPIAVVVVGCLLIQVSAEACVGCGQSRLFSPKIMALSMAFFFLPVTFVILFALKLRKDAKSDAAKAAAESATSDLK